MTIRSVLVIAVAALALAVTGCAAGSSGPITAADGFLGAFAARDIEAAADRTTRPEKAFAALSSAWEELGAEELHADTGAARIAGDTATVDYTYEWRLPGSRTWTYAGQLPMVRTGGAWTVRWSGVAVHPRLGDTQTMALSIQPAPRARVNEQSGSDVLVPGTVSRVTFDAADSADPHRVATALSEVLADIDERLTPDRILDSARAADGVYTVIVLNEVEFGRAGPRLIGLPGVRVTQEWDMAATDRKFAPDLMTQVRQAVIDEVDGRSGWRVVARNAGGAETGVLYEVAAQPAPSFALSVDRRIQNAAQRAVDGRREQTMMVVIEPSTGGILAVAQNASADRDGPVATIGQYPPGSVFKTVTAAAAMNEGIATPDTVVSCPSAVTIGERMIPNYNGFSVGDVPMTTAYARSCNTSFARLASELPESALTDSAAAFGIGPDYAVVGLPTFSGSVPATDDRTQRTEDGIGQGRVVVSPFGMALLAAAVASGSAPTPYLIAGRETVVDGPRPALAPDVVRGLRAMMRQVVVAGTADRIADQGEVFGKTGEAEVEGGSHSWFVGYRGDIAFATLLVRGGSSDNAVAVTRDMLAALPPGY
ncbi:penicillin-binding transpeptidase domain-containing protein [Nocardia grenadensis]|uniref:penicillin-binding transpeptidase domain-containing protein n=1 Tax=Nocardia grenadensis TaxID=931537 RepID=UPI0007A39A61|nr:penicillin-binding transpeptidase domain-containing protein [Nocardia grenadensis]